MDIVYILIFYFALVSSSAARNSHGIQTIVRQKKIQNTGIISVELISEACVEEYDVINTEFDLYSNDIIARQQWKTAQQLLEMSSV